jgi:hypothetical protein
VRAEDVQHVRRFDAARAQGYGERLIRRVLKGVIGRPPPVRVELDPRTIWECLPVFTLKSLKKLLNCKVKIKFHIITHIFSEVWCDLLIWNNTSFWHQLEIAFFTHLSMTPEQLKRLGRKSSIPYLEPA